MGDEDRDLLDEQIRYYRARAAEYDTTTTPDEDPYAAAAARTRSALRVAQPRGRVLELAAGTGQWTGLLAERADELTAIDSRSCGVPTTSSAAWSSSAGTHRFKARSRSTGGLPLDEAGNP